MRITNTGWKPVLPPLSPGILVYALVREIARNRPAMRPAPHRPSPEQVEAILAAAVEIGDEADRRAFVERACGGDKELRRRVEELIASHFSAGSFLDSPASPVRDLLAAGERTVEERNAYEPGAEGPGDTIGRYKLLE